MVSKEEHNNKDLLAEVQESCHNSIVLKMLIEIYAYCITDDTVDGMHLAPGKPCFDAQMNV